MSSLAVKRTPTSISATITKHETPGANVKRFPHHRPARAVPTPGAQRKRSMKRSHIAVDNRGFGTMQSKPSHHSTSTSTSTRIGRVSPNHASQKNTTCLSTVSIANLKVNYTISEDLSGEKEKRKKCALLLKRSAMTASSSKRESPRGETLLEQPGANSGAQRNNNEAKNNDGLYKKQHAEISSMEHWSNMTMFHSPRLPPFDVDGARRKLGFPDRTVFSYINPFGLSMGDLLFYHDLSPIITTASMPTQLIPIAPVVPGQINNSNGNSPVPNARRASKPQHSDGVLDQLPMHILWPQSNGLNLLRDDYIPENTWDDVLLPRTAVSSPTDARNIDTI